MQRLKTEFQKQHKFPKIKMHTNLRDILKICTTFWKIKFFQNSAEKRVQKAALTQLEILLGQTISYATDLFLPTPVVPLIRFICMVISQPTVCFQMLVTFLDEEPVYAQSTCLILQPNIFHYIIQSISKIKCVGGHTYHIHPVPS